MQNYDDFFATNVPENNIDLHINNNASELKNENIKKNVLGIQEFIETNKTQSKKLKIEFISLQHYYKNIEYQINFEINSLKNYELNIEDLKSSFEKQKKHNFEENSFCWMTIKHLNEDINFLKMEINETEKQLKYLEGNQQKLKNA